MKTERNLFLLHKFWQSEIIANHLYSFLGAQYKDNERKEIILRIGKMEQGHATVWDGIATKSHGVSFRITLPLRAKILWAKLLSFVLPFTIFIHYMEHQERNAILDYSKVLEAYQDDEQTRSIILNIIRQEIGHEWHMMEQIADKEWYVAKTREALDAMTVGIIGTAGLVVGLLAADASTRTIGLTGIMATIGATIAHMSISYVSSKAAYDLHEGRIREIHVKKEINPAVLKRELELVLSERGVGNETVKAMMEIIRDDTTLLSNLLKSIKFAGEVSVPREAIKTTGLFLITGALPILLPFFIGHAWDSDPWIPAVVAFFLALLTISGAGFFVAVLSAKKILVKIAHSISVIMGTCFVTYLVGLAARIAFGIEAAH